MKQLVIVKETACLLRDWSFILLIPVVIALIFGELYMVGSFLAVFAGTLLVSTLIVKFTKGTAHAQLKEGLIIIAGTWLAVTLIGALIFYINLPVSYLDALFESMSSWTTTGLSVLTPETLPKTILFWRSLGQWIGGLGVVALAAGNLFRTGNAIVAAEGRDQRIRPNVIHSIRIMGGIYLFYTLVGALFLVIFGMGVFDAANHAMTAIATGGMSTRNDSIGAYDSPGVHVIIIVLMIIGVISFVHHARLLSGKAKVLRSVQNQALALIIIIPTTLLVIMRLPFGQALFHVISAMGTGFSTVNLNLWPKIGLFLLFIPMVIGGVAGSTAGGVKIHRVIISLQKMLQQIKKLRSPHRIFRNTLDGQHYQLQDVIRIETFLVLYLVLLIVGTGIFVIAGHAPAISLFEVASAQGNVGLSLGVHYGNIEKVTLIFLMWAGRLEIWAVLLLIMNLVKRRSRT